MATGNIEVVRRLFQAVEDRDDEPMCEIYDGKRDCAGGALVAVRRRIPRS